MAVRKPTNTDSFQARFATSELVASLRSELANSEALEHADLASSSWAFLAALIHRIEPMAPVLMVSPGLKQQEGLHQDLQTWLAWLGDASRETKTTDSPETPEFFPAWETLPHEAKLSHADVISERILSLIHI